MAVMDSVGGAAQDAGSRWWAPANGGGLYSKGGGVCSEPTLARAHGNAPPGSLR